MPPPVTPPAASEEIGDDDVPMTDLPKEDVPLEDIPDEEVPLSDVPKTGDMSGLWLALTALSGSGLAGLTLLGKKRGKTEDV